MHTLPHLLTHTHSYIIAHKHAYIHPHTHPHNQTQTDKHMHGYITLYVKTLSQLYAAAHTDARIHIDI